MTTNVIFTRYLYLQSGVLESLEKSILKRDFDESLFWAYEIYFSGFEEEIFGFLFQMMERYFANFPKLAKFLKKKEREWKTNKQEEILGTILKNLCLRDHTSIETTKRQVYVIVKESDVDCFRTIEVEPRWKTLQQKCTYDGVKTSEPNQSLLDTYRNDWLFYACFSPIWKTRVLEYNGRVDNDKKTVVFENDDDLEKFYDKYGYEPDEQSLEIQKRCLFI